MLWWHLDQDARSGERPLVDCPNCDGLGIVVHDGMPLRERYNAEVERGLRRVMYPAWDKAILDALVTDEIRRLMHAGDITPAAMPDIEARAMLAVTGDQFRALKQQ